MDIENIIEGTKVEEEKELPYIDLDKKFGFKIKQTKKWLNR